MKRVHLSADNEDWMRSSKKKRKGKRSGPIGPQRKVQVLKQELEAVGCDPKEKTLPS